MPAGRIVLPPYFPVRDGNGYPVSGAKLYVYENETTTLATIYTDFALTVPSANPVEANASGVFPAIFAEAGTEADPVLYSLSVTDDDGRAPGRPSAFDNYRPSVDYETATLILAEAASESAQAALADINEILLTQPESVAIAGRALIDGSNIISPATFRTNIGTAAPNVVGPSVAVQGSVSAIDYQFGPDASSLGGLHPTGKTYYGWSFSKSFTLAANPSPGPAPAFTMEVVANNMSAAGDVGAYMGIALSRGANTKALGMNLIVGSDVAYTGLKLEGCEIDIQPAPGSTVIDGFGLALNAFSQPMPVAAIVIGGVSGGKFANGINIIGGISGSGLVVTQNATMTSLINTGTGVFSDDAIILSNTHRLRFSGTTGANSAYIWVDSGNGLRYVASSTEAHNFRNHADTSTQASISNDGIDLGLPGQAYRVNGVKVVGARDTGWTATTGTGSKGAFAATAAGTANAAYVQADFQSALNRIAAIEARVVALDTALRTHGLIGV